MAASTDNVESVTGLLEGCISKHGFEVYPLKVLFFFLVCSNTKKDYKMWNVLPVNPSTARTEELRSLGSMIMCFMFYTHWWFLTFASLLNCLLLPLCLSLTLCLNMFTGWLVQLSVAPLSAPGLPRWLPGCGDTQHSCHVWTSLLALHAGERLPDTVWPHRPVCQTLCVLCCLTGVCVQ